MALNRQYSTSRSRRPGELRSYMHSEGFSRLAGQPTAPGSLLHTRSPLLRKIVLIAAELLFLAIGIWFIFR